MALYINGNKASGGTDVVHLTQAQYDALPSSKNYDDKVYMITDANGDGSQFQPVIYSEEEREIGVWIDGKPLYQRTYKVNFTSFNSNGKVILTVTDIDTIALREVSLLDEYDNRLYPLNSQPSYTNDGIVIYGYVDFNTTPSSTYSLCIRSLGTNYNNRDFTAFINLQYTKLTDIAGSGTWTPQGVPAVHYSTDEQVVGVDEEGNTLYEKFYRVTNVYSTNTVIDSTKTPANTKIKGLIFGSFTIGGAYNNTQYCTPHIGTNADIRIFMNENGLSINAEGFNTSTYPITDCYFRIQYIKIQGGN